MIKVMVSADALRQVLNALNGSGLRVINELLATRGPLVGDTNPINILCNEYTIAIADQLDPEYRIQQLGFEVAMANELIAGQQSRLQQLEAELKRNNELILEISDTLEDLKSYGFACADGPLEHCIPFNAIADKAREALTLESSI